MRRRVGGCVGEYSGFSVTSLGDGSVGVSGFRSPLGGTLQIDQIGFYGQQYFDQAFSLFLRKTGQRFLPRLRRKPSQTVQNRLCPGREIEPPDPPVGGVAPTLDPGRLLQTVDMPSQGDVLDLENFGEGTLGDAFEALQIMEDTPLGAREPERACTRVEPFAHKARHVAQQEADAPLQLFGWHGRILLSRLIVSQLFLSQLKFVSRNVRRFGTPDTRGRRPNDDAGGGNRQGTLGAARLGERPCARSGQSIPSAERWRMAAGAIDAPPLSGEATCIGSEARVRIAACFDLRPDPCGPEPVRTGGGRVLGPGKASAARQRKPESRTRRFLDAMFRERELLLRSEGRLRYLHLTRRAQIGLFAVLSGIGLWVVGATALSLVQQQVIANKESAIKEARVAYEDLLDEVLAYQKKVAAVTTKLKRNQSYLLRQISEVSGLSEPLPTDTLALSEADGKGDEAAKSRQALRRHLTRLDIELQQMMETNSLLEGSLNKIKAELALAEEERAQIIRTRAKLRERVRELETDLIETRARAARLERQVASLSDSLSQARGSYAKLAEERSVLERRKAELEGDLRSALARGDSLHAEVTKLSRELDAARAKINTIAGQRQALQSLVSQLASQLQAAERRNAVLEQDLGTVVARLKKATGGREEAGNGRMLRDLPLRKQVDVLLARLSDLHAAQENVLAELGNKAAGNIQEAERLIAMTGLDLEKLMAHAGGMPMGQGGPFIAAESGSEGGADGLAGTVSQIESQLGRWEVLKSVLRVMPLVSPVDFYHVASGFGRRRDPITRRRAMHYGVDLAGWRKAPVYATAPGKVVFAGRKARFGKLIEIDHGFGLRTRYGHLNRILVKKGQIVGHREKIGLLGSTGRSTGPHVHYEVLFDGKQIDPMKFIKAGRHVFKGPKDVAEGGSRKSG